MLSERKEKNIMRNIEKYNTCGCITMSDSDFLELIDTLTDGLLSVEFNYDGLSFYHSKKAEETDTYWNEDINKTLSDYFETNVTSIHIDDAESPLVWICCTN